MDAESINQLITQKASELKTQLKQSIAAQGMQHVGSIYDTEPLANISTRISKNFGIINRIRIKFKRSGVFVHKGVGRGTKAKDVGNTKRKPKPWFNPVVEQFADELANELADEWANISLNAIKIK